MKYAYELKKSFESSGAKITARVRSAEPIKEDEHFILRKDAALNMAECVQSLAETMRPRALTV